MTAPDLSLATKARWNASAVAVGSLSRLLGGVVVARLLGPDLNGQFAFLLWLTESLVLVFSVGLPVALKRYLALNMGQGDDVAAQRIMRFSLRAGIVLSLFAALAAYWLAQQFLLAATTVTEMAAALALLVAAQFWSGLAQATLIGLQHFRAYARLVMVFSLILLAGQIVGATRWGLHGAIYGTLASYAVGAVLFLWGVAQARLETTDMATSESSLDSSVAAYARNSWLAAVISAVVWGRAELFFLNHFSTGREAGFFAAGLVFSSLVVQAVNLVSGALLPHLSYIVGEGGTTRLHNDYRRLTVLIALLTCPLALGGVALMPELIKLVFGTAYADATPAAQWLMATGLLAFATVGSAVVYGYGDVHIVRNWSVLGASLMVPLCTLLAPTAGAAGVAATRFFVQALVIAVGFFVLRGRYGLPVPLRTLGMLLAAGVCCGLAAGLTSQLAGGGLGGTVLGTAGGATIYCLLLRVLRVVPAEVATSLDKLFSKLPPMLARPARALVSLLYVR